MILITGGTGFIGTQLVSSLEGNPIVLVGRKPPKGYKGRFHYKELSALTDFGECLQGVDKIVHMAALAHNSDLDDSQLDDINVKATLDLATQAATLGVKRFIFISSIGVIGSRSISPLNEESAECPHSLYAKSKLRAEKGLLEISNNTEMEVVIIRPVLVYGLDAPGNFRKLLLAIKKLPVLPFGLANNKRSFISVGNLVAFIRICLVHPAAKNEVFCISDGEDISIKEFTNAVAQGLKKPVKQLPIPPILFRILGKILRRSDQIEQLFGDLQVDTSKAKKLLAWSPPENMISAMKSLKRG